MDGYFLLGWATKNSRKLAQLATKQFLALREQ